MHTDNREYTMSNNERRQRHATHKYMHMLDRLITEITEDMVTFDHETHIIKIEDEGHGYMTCSVKKRGCRDILHKIRFKKKPGLGVVYQFRSADRLNFLAATPETLEASKVA